MPKSIRDPLYGFIEVPESYLSVVDHKLVQRLRWVSQLPLEQLVYPAAQHSRFEHSIGTMHLARKAARSLISNSKPEFHRLSKKDDFFQKLNKNDKEAIFIESAGLLGLLHDVGHAPFSHTMEDACSHATFLDYKYNHEQIGYLLGKRILSEAPLKDEIKHILLYTLNKSIKSDELPPLIMLLRDIVDGPFDVDKGDYLLRDSYHCGVVYGVYDHNRLWDNIIITDTNRIGVNEKGALEAWSLRIARYKMFTNVYKHHIRNITDALLIEIITIALDQLRKDPGKLRKILPITSDDDLSIDGKITSFCFWNDTTLLEALSSSGISSIQSKIENFTTRNLFKRCCEINLAEDFSEIMSNLQALHPKVLSAKQLLAKKNIHINYTINKQIVPPIFEDEVQIYIRVKNAASHFVPLADHLGFSKPQQDNDESYIIPTFLQIFSSNTDRAYTHDINQEINLKLQEFRVTDSIELPQGNIPL